ncbi:MAG TPA: zf-HC2 domain-containing protein [Bacillota bacterium]|nr:zf-HC2 domain-containing protein [Bacillota bacterium]
MKCIKIRELLTDYLRRETDSQTTAAVASHLEICDDCARELEFLKAYYTKVGSLPTIEAPDNFLENIKQRLVQTENLKSKSRRPFICWFEKMAGIGLIPQIAGTLTIALIVFLTFNSFQVGQKMRRNANLLQMEPQTAQTASKDKSEEMMMFDSNQPQSKSVPAPVAKNRRADNGVNSTSEGERPGRQATGERRLILTVNQQALMANKGLTAAGSRMEERKGAVVSDENALSEKSVSKKDQGLSASNSAQVLAVKTIIKSLAGEITQEDLGKENGQSSLLIRIPVQNYALFLEKLGTIGSVNEEGSNSPSPLKISGTVGTTAHSGNVAGSEPKGQSGTGAQSNLQQFIEARLILKGVF